MFKKSIVIGISDDALQAACLLANSKVLTLLVVAKKEFIANVRQAITKTSLLYSQSNWKYLHILPIHNLQGEQANADAYFDYASEGDGLAPGLDQIANQAKKESYWFFSQNDHSLTKLKSNFPKGQSLKVCKCRFSVSPRLFSTVEYDCENNEDFETELNDFFERRLGRYPLAMAGTTTMCLKSIERALQFKLIALFQSGAATVEELEFVFGPLLGFSSDLSFSKLSTLPAKQLTKDYQALQKESIALSSNISIAEGITPYLKQDNQQILCLRQDGSHSPSQNPDLSTIGDVLKIESPGVRLQSLMKDPSPLGQISWALMSEYIRCAITLLPQCRSDIKDFDEAIKHGLNFKMGPFECWNVMGLSWIGSKLEAEGIELPSWYAKCQADKREDIYRITPQGEETLNSNGQAVLSSRESLSYNILKQAYQPIQMNPHGALWDLNDGIYLCETHGPMNRLTPQLVDILRFSLQKANNEGKGLVISTAQENFSLGIDTLSLLMAAKENKFEDIRTLLRMRQQLGMEIKHSSVPVICYNDNLCAGAGYELLQHCSRNISGVNLRCGFNEFSYGLSPMGGGLKELMASHYPKASSPEKMMEVISPFFEDIINGQLTKSALEAQEKNYLNPKDLITAKKHNLLKMAKDEVTRLWELGYSPKPENPLIPVPGIEGRAVLDQMIFLWHRSGRIGQGQKELAQGIAKILTGGEVTHLSSVPESYLLELECELALSQLGKKEIQTHLENQLKREGVIRA
ncbi:MAG: enoyl-CoA hydratase/isomerase family protein [Planctomycetes bacterium]|nr:enoyl-CoA hydratase/isomerase family protein [Planctomycetota bacterium]